MYHLSIIQTCTESFISMERMFCLTVDIVSLTL